MKKALPTIGPQAVYKKQNPASSARFRGFPVITGRFERPTRSLEGCCSIQLSYVTIFLRFLIHYSVFLINCKNLEPGIMNPELGIFIMPQS